MNKRIATFLLALSWVLGQVVFCYALPDAQLDKPSSSEQSKINPIELTPPSDYLSQAISVEVPTFKSHWEDSIRLFLFGFSKLSGSLLEASWGATYVENSLALFDIKTTFIHFFHAW